MCDDLIMYNIDTNLQRPKMYLCAQFGCSAPVLVRDVSGQRNKHTDRLRFLENIKRQGSLLKCDFQGSFYNGLVQ